MINPQKELEKLKKKEEQLTSTINKLKQVISNADYNMKVPINVQANDKEKLLNSEGELEKLNEAMEALLTL